MTQRTARLKYIHVAALMLAGMFLAISTRAGDEVCDCSPQVTLTGTFTHRKDNNRVNVDGAGNNAAAYHEEVNGQDFTVSIAALPAGKYTITIGEAETVATSAGQRVFTVTSGDATIAKDFDIFSAAGGASKVTSITGTIDHGDDALKGPLKITFTAKPGSQGPAKFNTIELKNEKGELVDSFAASDLADAFTASAQKVPEIKDAPFWRDSSKPLNDRIDDLVRRMSLAEKVAQLKNAAPAITRLGLPAYDYWNEALHGVANNGVATVFPEPCGGASSWNPELFRQEGNVIGVEGRAKFNDYANQHNGDSKWWYGLDFWTPNVNIFRDPRWGRGQETYGEDPYLTGEIGVQFVKGMQGDDPNYMLAMACAKHYAVHSGPEAQRHTIDVKADDRDLYETYLPQFERVVREGHVGGVMSAYNSVDGVPCSASSFLLTDTLRKSWGFEGYVVSDCDAIGDVWRSHHYVTTAEEAAADSIKAGCNLCCGSDYNALVRSVQSNLVSEKEIDNALHHTLWIRFRLGIFDPADKVPYSKYTLKDNDTPEHHAVSLELARQSLVLLKNDGGILPIDRTKYKKIAVIGPNSDSKSMLAGNYHGTPSKPVSILAGIKQLAGPGIEITNALGSLVNSGGRTAPYSGQDNNPNRPAADLNAEGLKVANDADLIIYVGGITAGQEGEQFDRTAIELPDVQEQYIHALQATGKPMVMVNCSGGAMALTWEAQHLPAILQAWYPGGDGGRAVAEALFGDVNPSGHLPVTFYKATTDLPAFNDYSMANRTYRYFSGQPLYAFGHGLSYTTFDYSAGKLDNNKIASNGKVKVTFTLKNTGNRDGDEVAQLYYRHVNSKVPQAKLALCGFSRVSLKHGGTTDVTLEIPAERLRYWDEEKKQYVVEPGDYEFLVGAASDDIKLKLPLSIATP